MTCRICENYPEACSCALHLHPYTIDMLERAASACSTDRVRIDLLSARRILIEHDAGLSGLLPADQFR